MYVAKKTKLDYLNGAFIRLDLKVYSTLAERWNVHWDYVHCYCYRYPCGRIKIVVPFSGMVFTGCPLCAPDYVIFDSVKSLFSVPGVRILTDYKAVYTALGMSPRCI